MLVPLILLAALSLTGGWIGIPQALGGSDRFSQFLDPAVAAGHDSNPEDQGIRRRSSEEVPIQMNQQGAQPVAPASTVQSSFDEERIFSLCSVIVALFGWFLADFLYRRQPELATRWTEQAQGLHSLLLHKYWIDEIYSRIFVLPVLFLSRSVLSRAVERGLIDGGGQLAAGSVRGLGVLVERVQSGNIRSYAGWLTIGAVALLALTYFGFVMHL
jgi:NADH-quinone oxidoreductase subunit L